MIASTFPYLYALPFAANTFGVLHWSVPYLSTSGAIKFFLFTDQITPCELLPMFRLIMQYVQRKSDAKPRGTIPQHAFSYSQNSIVFTLIKRSLHFWPPNFDFRATISTTWLLSTTGNVGLLPIPASRLEPHNHGLISAALCLPQVNRVRSVKAPWLPFLVQ